MVIRAVVLSGGKVVAEIPRVVVDAWENPVSEPSIYSVQEGSTRKVVHFFFFSNNNKDYYDGHHLFIPWKFLWPPQSEEEDEDDVLSQLIRIRDLFPGGTAA